MKLYASCSFSNRLSNTETFKIALLLPDAYTYVRKNTIHTLTPARFNATDVHFIGRRVKIEKFLRDMSSDLKSKQTKKRKSRSEENGADYSLNSGKVLKEENLNDTLLREEREDVYMDENIERNVLEASNASNISSQEVYIDKHIHKRNDIHLLSDLRGLTNSQEKIARYYAAHFFCSGGDNPCKKISKYFDKKGVGSSIKLNEMTSLPSTSCPTSISANSTTAMDFER